VFSCEYLGWASVQYCNNTFSIAMSIMLYLGLLVVIFLRVLRFPPTISSILCEIYYIKSNLAMSNFKEPHISLRVKAYSSNHSYLINILYLLHLDLYLKLMYPWIRITLIQNNEVFCMINFICKCICISLLSWLHTYSILIHDGCHI
jgi:hypothetical protein